MRKYVGVILVSTTKLLALATFHVTTVAALVFTLSLPSVSLRSVLILLVGWLCLTYWVSLLIIRAAPLSAADLRHNEQPKNSPDSRRDYVET